MIETTLKKFLESKDRNNIEFPYFIQQQELRQYVDKDLFDTFLDLESLVRLDIVSSDTYRINIKYYSTEGQFLARYIPFKIKEAVELYSPENVDLGLIEDTPEMRAHIKASVLSSSYIPLPMMIEEAKIDFNLKLNRAETFEGDINIDEVCDVLLRDQFSIESIEVQLPIDVKNRVGTVNNLLGKKFVGFVADFKDIKYLKDSLFEKLDLKSIDVLKFRIAIARENLSLEQGLSIPLANRIMESIELDEYIRVAERR